MTTILLLVITKTLLIVITKTLLIVSIMSLLANYNKLPASNTQARLTCCSTLFCAYTQMIVSPHKQKVFSLKQLKPIVARFYDHSIHLTNSIYQIAS